jgi:hypothetical protein
MARRGTLNFSLQRRRRSSAGKLVARTVASRRLKLSPGITRLRVTGRSNRGARLPIGRYTLSITHSGPHGVTRRPPIALTITRR